MREIGRKYPNCGFGGMFSKWVFSDNPEPYNSFGNGAAMRVSPAGFVAKSEWDVEHLAETVTAVTNDHEEGIKGAKATAVAIAMARGGALKGKSESESSADIILWIFGLMIDGRPIAFTKPAKKRYHRRLSVFSKLLLSRMQSARLSPLVATAIPLEQ